MTVTFELRTAPQVLDTPLVNLRNKKFNRVGIDCIDDVSYIFVKDDDPKKYINSTPVFGDKVISLFSEHFSFERLEFLYDKTHIPRNVGHFISCSRSFI